MNIFYKVFCLLLSIDFEAVTGLGLGRFFGCSEYKRPLRGGLACCSVRELLWCCVNWQLKDKVERKVVN